MMAHAGAHSVSGTVSNTGTPNVPVMRRVRLVHQQTGKFIRETWSDSATGAWSFGNIAAGIYSVYSIDHTGAYNGEITTDIVVPTPPAP